MANIPGAQTLIPGVYSQATTSSRGIAVGQTSRVAAIIGEGMTEFPVVVNAIGGGKDGLNADYKTLTALDGRHFLLKDGDIRAPFVPGITKLFRNGAKLKGREHVIDGQPFPAKFQYQFDPTTGKIELQTSALKDQGGSYYSVRYISSTTPKTVSLANLALLNVNSIKETWMIRCVRVDYDSSGNPIAGTAQFIAVGSISGQKYDANGNSYIWKALASVPSGAATVTNNGVLQFYVIEGNPSTPFEPGDQFSIQIDSQILSAGDTLTASCIPVSFINDPVTYSSLSDVYKYHGSPSEQNTLSLGAQLAFENGAPTIIGVQAAPALPMRTSIVLTDEMYNLLNPLVGTPTVSNDDFVFALPFGFVPDVNSTVHVFDFDPLTDEERQVLPNKYDDVTYPAVDFNNATNLQAFITSPSAGNAHAANCYTLGTRMASVDSGLDGIITRSATSGYKATFQSSSVYFDLSYLDAAHPMWIRILDSKNAANMNQVPDPGAKGCFKIHSVSNGVVNLDLTTVPVSNIELNRFNEFAADSANVSFRGYNSAGTLIVALDGTDGAITPTVGTDIATLDSTSLKQAFVTTPAYRSQLSVIELTTGNNKGKYDVTGIDVLNIVTLKKVFVTENKLRFEILDENEISWYIALNSSVIPNGHGVRINLVSEDSATFVDNGWSNAFTALERVDCDIVVALPNQTITPIFQNNIAHCSDMSSLRYKKERVPFIGAIMGLGVDNIAGNPSKDVAVEDLGVLEGIQGSDVGGVLLGEDIRNYSVIDSYGTVDRNVYIYPDLINKTMVATNAVTSIDGYFLAAALAGYETSKVNLQEPSTNKVLTGFSIPRSRLLTPTQLEQLQAAGVLTVVPAGANGGRVISGITTTQSGIVERQELSILFIRDALSKTFRLMFNRFIGTASSTSTQTDLNTVALDGLRSFATKGWITKSRNLVVVQDPVEPRQWNVSVEVQPAYGINWVYLSTKVEYFG